LISVRYKLKIFFRDILLIFYPFLFKKKTEEEEEEDKLEGLKKRNRHITKTGSPFFHHSFFLLQAVI
jgi:hypothetical protein